jgi:hypothetical protein
MGMVLNKTSDPMGKTPVEQELFTKTRDYYSSCLRKDIIEKRGFKPLKVLAQSIIRKWSSALPTLTVLSQLQGQMGVKVLFQSKYTSVPAKNIHELRLQIVPAQAYKVSKSTVERIMKIFVKNRILKTEQFDKVVDMIWKFERRHWYFC